MKIEFEIKDRDLLNKLNNIIPKLEQEAAKIVSNESPPFVPVRTGALQRSVKAENNTVKALHYWKFVDKGTRYIKARNFTKKIIQSSIVKVKKVTLDLLQRELNAT